MLPASLTTLIVFAYLVLLFFVAYQGDKRITRQSAQVRNIIYGLSLAVYCSSWTFLGAVGSAVKTGWDYFAIFLGPILMFTIGLRLVRKIIVISKQQNITTISDFISTRFGSSRSIASIVTIIAVTGAMPYIALQLKAISMAFNTLTTNDISSTPESLSAPFIWQDTAFYTAIVLIVFAIMFGTRNYDATEHNKGVVSAVAFESIIKLIAIMVISYYAVYLVFGGSTVDISARNFLPLNSSPFQTLDFLIKTLLSFFAAILLPRQFHVGVIEAENDYQASQSAKYFVLYLLLFSIVIAPITFAGITTMPNSSNPDLFVLTLPLNNGQMGLSIFAYLGAVSAATGMVIVSSIAISTMVCNDLALPWLLKHKSQSLFKHRDFPNAVLIIRRVSIALIILLSYGYYSITDGTKALANIGLISFAATAQFAPAVVTALYSRSGNAAGVKMGLLLGFITWAYTLLLPNILPTHWLNALFSADNPFHPEHLFNIPFSSPLAHGVLWSLSLNVAGIVIGSWWHKSTTVEAIQADSFVDAQLSRYNSSSSSTIYAKYADARQLCNKVIGPQQASKLFDSLHFRSDFNEQDAIKISHLKDIERSLSGVVGNSSAKLLVQQVLIEGSTDRTDLFDLVEQTSSALRFGQSILQSTLEHISQAISVVDSNQNLIAWNTRYAEMFNYPDSLIRVGTPIRELLEHNGNKGDFGDSDPQIEIDKRLQHLRNGTAYVVERKRPDGSYIRIQGNPIPNGGFVTSYSDITELKNIEQQLEQRVEERTRELEQLTQDLKKATEDKTQFLAAASHDLLQPINAARLFAYGIKSPDKELEERVDIARKIDQALCSADNTLRTLLNISQLDRGSIKPNIAPIELNKLLKEILNEMSVQATEKNIELRYQATSCIILSDYRLLFSVLQNIISNAVRYTQQGKILIGCRRHQQQVLIQVYDTGIGINEDDQAKIFDEFSKGTQDEATKARGVGLGLSIVKRICQLLQHPLSFESKLGSGSVFSISVPLSHQQYVNHQPFATDTGMSFQAEDNNDLALLANISVLCLDNDMNALQGLHTLLSQWGCIALPCSNLEEARELLAEDHVDCVVADYQLDNDELGLDLLVQLKNNKIAVKNAPSLLLVTATQDDKLFQQCTVEGIDYLHKPLNPDALKTWLLKTGDGQSTIR